jgi:hypothetical protein
MSRRPRLTYPSADEQKQMAANRFKEAMPTTPGPDASANRVRNFGEMKGYLASKELEPPK